MIVLSDENLDSLDNLNWMLESSSGEFALMIACCNYGDLQQVLMDELVKMSALHIKVVRLQEGETSLLNALHREISDQETSEGNENPIPYSLMLTGWERVQQLEKLLASVNQVRESLKGEFPVPMVFWVNQGVLKTVLKSAPDLASWSSHYQFRLPSAELNGWLGERVECFQDGVISPQDAKELAMALEAVQRDIQEEGATLSAEGRAHLELLLGLAAVAYGGNRQIEEAIGHYQAALEIWQEQGNLEQQGYVCSQLAYAYFRKVFPTRENVQFVPPKLFKELREEQRREGSEWQVAYGYVQRTLALWEEAGTLENVARTFHRWLGILRYLERWELLAQLARQVMPFHEDEEKWPKRYRLRDYSVLAEVAFEQEQWEEAEQWSEKVLQEALGDLDPPYPPLSKGGTKTVPLSKGETNKVPLPKGDLGGSNAQGVTNKVPLPKGDLGGSNAQGVTNKVPLSKGDLGGSNAVAEQPKVLHSNQYYVVLSRLILAKVYRLRGERNAAIEQLQWVRESGVERAPRLHVEALELLSVLLFEQKEYLEAYEVKRELRTAEFEYNFRGFVGASRLTCRPQQRGVATEIRAAGREEAVKQLVERVLDTDHVVTAIYGYSGVGKSSLIQAGLVPALAEKVHRDRIIPIVLRRYGDWQGQIGEQLERFGLGNREWGIGNGGEGIGNGEWGMGNSPSIRLREKTALREQPFDCAQGTSWTEGELLRVWRAAEGGYERIVLIFDQFEEFFFEFRTRGERRPLFGLLAEGLERCPGLQIVISIRQDFIHYLFEERELPRVGDLLSRENCYPLSYFRPDEAVEIIRRLTQKTSFHPEEALLQRLVEDLAGEGEEVIPIELQIVGSQLEDSYITRLEEYERLNEGVLEPKTELVRRYIETVVKDCGTEHERSAYWVLFLLTDEDLRRPVKREEELKREVREKIEEADLSLVLKILVGSGLVLLIEERGEAGYQLVHDYLVRYVREQAPELRQLQEKLEREQGKREAAERSLAEIEKKVQRSSWLLGLTSVASVAILIFTFGLVRQARVERKLALDGTRWERLGVKTLRQFENVPSQPLEALHSALQTAQQLYPHTVNQPVTEYAAYSPISTLQQVSHTIREQNKIPHEASVWGVVFSPDGSTLATRSTDGTAKITEVESGQTLHTITHEDWVTGVVFSPDGSTLATGSADGTAKITAVESGQTLHTITHEDLVTGVVFSPDGSTLATGSTDNTAKITAVESGETLHTITHKGSVWGVVFSPDGSTLATRSTDNTVKITEVESGQTLHTITHEDLVRGVVFSPDGSTLATRSTDGTAKITAVESGQTLHTITHEDTVRGVVFSPDGSTLATGSADNTAKIIAVESGKATILQGHSDDITDMAWHSDGDRIATGSRDGTVRVWTRTGQELAVFRGHQGEVRQIRWDEEGRTLTSVAIDGNTVTIRTLPVETLEELIARGCRWVRPYLNSNNKEMKECEEYWE
ncbi:hypothetical protein PMG71_21510 [Roseofilum sp. BLCC_M154]|uniref:Novel STAND NTPase 1 domain-containing protein n=1 Tax=Roseofilum acuticapitatum BLCC-M154 TaxID=3022444 RepID=A0ABT7B140_9CYAN|nr:hypothetical protein [Roseofilum acuticapitatum]MDJ1172013.1 hypothetical protein [Roseofilum acuticapitatum BLCC-M154]